MTFQHERKAGKGSGKAKRHKEEKMVLELRKKFIEEKSKNPQGIKVRTEKHLLGEAIRSSSVTLAMHGRGSH